MLVPSAEFVIDALQDLAAITCVLAVAFMISIALKCRPAARHALWCGTLACVLAAPVVVVVLRQAGFQFVSLPVSITRCVSAAVTQKTARDDVGDLRIENTSAQANENTTRETALAASTNVAALGHDIVTGGAPVPASSTAEQSASSNSEQRAPVDESAEMNRAQRRLQIWWTWVAIIWLAGSACLSGRLLHGMIQLRRIARGLAFLDSNRLMSQRAAVVRALDTPELPPIAVSAHIGGPLVIGLARPCVVLPAWLIERVPPRQLVDVLVHECAHVVRRDQWIVPLQRLAEILFWPHPLIHVMNRGLNQAREEVCDNYVLAASSPPDFAETLLNIATQCRPARRLESLAMIGRHGTLEGRVKFLLDGRRARATRVSAFRRFAMYTLLVVILVSVAVLRTRATSAGDESATSAEVVAAGPNSNSPRDGGQPDATRPKDSSPMEDSQPRAGGNAREVALKSPKVKDAVNAGTKYIVSQQQTDGSWKSAAGVRYTNGVTSLALLALMNSGMTRDDKPVSQGLQYLRELPAAEPSTTYERSLVICAFVAANDGKRDVARIQRLVEQLEETQLTKGVASGAWSYPLPSAELFDHSNSHFAVIALCDAADFGIAVNLETWRRARQHWLQTQTVDGGWNYTGDAQLSTGSMTAAGISSLQIVARMLRDEKNRHEKGEVPTDPATDEALKRAFVWLDRNFIASRNPGDQRWLLYYLHGIARAGRLSGKRLFGKHDWHQEGTEFLLQHQNPRDGYWRETELGGTDRDQLISTSFALLFLSNASAPVDGRHSKSPR